MSRVSQPSPLEPARQRAQLLADQGDRASAIAMLEHAVSLGRVNLGEDDPGVLGAAHQLARLHQALDDPSAARRLLEEAYAAGQWRLGDSDPLILEISYDLGLVAEELGNRHEARKALSRVVELGQPVLGDGHWAVLKARAYLAGNHEVLRHDTLVPEAPAAVAAPRDVASLVAPRQASSEPLIPRQGGMPLVRRVPGAQTPPLPEEYPQMPQQRRVPRGAVQRSDGPGETTARIQVSPVEQPALRQSAPLQEPNPEHGYEPAPVQQSAFVQGPDQQTASPHTPAPWPPAEQTAVQQAPVPQPPDRQPHAQHTAYPSALRPAEQTAYPQPPAEWTGLDQAPMQQPPTDRAALQQPPAERTAFQQAAQQPRTEQTAYQQAPQQPAPEWTSFSQAPTQQPPTEWTTPQQPPAQQMPVQRTPVEPHTVIQPAMPMHDGFDGASVHRPFGPAPSTQFPPATTDGGAGGGRTDQRRGPVIFAAIAAVLAVSLAVVALVFVLADRGGDEGDGRDSDVPTLGGGPTPSGVQVRDYGTSVEITWRDPGQGKNSTIISGGHPGEVLKPMGEVGPGVTRFTLRGLNDQLDYCFVVVAVYGVNSFASSAQSCTKRPGPDQTG